MYCVNGKYFADLYRNRISGYADWCDRELCCGCYFNAANIGPYMSLDETCLSNGETMRQILARSKLLWGTDPILKPLKIKETH